MQELKFYQNIQILIVTSVQQILPFCSGMLKHVLCTFFGI